MLQVLKDRVLVEPVEVESETASGLVIPDQAKERPQRGEVIAVGTTVSEELEVGVTVIYSKYGGTELEDGGKSLIVLREADVIAVVSG